MKARLTKKEINQKKQQAAQYKGISYSAVRDDFTVRLRIGTDLMGKPIYFLPIRRYNDFGKAVKCLENYKELAARDLERKKHISFKTLRLHFEDRIDQIRQRAKAEPQSEEALTANAAIATLRIRATILKKIEKYAPVLYKKPLEDIKSGELQDVYEEMLKADDLTVNPKTLFDNISRIKSMFNGRDEEINKMLRNAGINVDNDKFSVYRIRNRMDKDINPEEKKKDRDFSISEIHSIITYALKMTDTKRDIKSDKAFLAVMLEIISGARISELLNITKGKIKHNDKVGTHIVLYRQRNRVTGEEGVAKTGQSNRVIPICGYVYDTIMRYINKYQLNDDDKLFFSNLNQKNRAVSDGQVGRYIREIEAAVGISHIKGRTNHAQRNGLITFFEGVLGIDQGTVRYFTGHTKGGDAHDRYFKDSNETVLKLRAKRFRAAQYAYIMTVLNDYPVEKAMELYNRHLTSSNKTDPEQTEASSLSKMEFFESIYNFAVIQGKSTDEVARSIEDKLLFSERIFPHDFYNKDSEISKEQRLYIIWRYGLEDCYKVESRKVREKYPNFESYMESKRLELENLYESYKLLSQSVDNGTETNDKGRTVLHSLVYSDGMRTKIIQIAANSKEVQEHYYNVLIDDRYKANNSFNDFLNDIADESDNAIKKEFFEFIKMFFDEHIDEYVDDFINHDTEYQTFYQNWCESIKKIAKFTENKK